MRIVRDREDARWLPSRFRFAIFRLIALIRMTFTAPRERRGIIIVIDRDQSTFENYTISIWYMATIACFFAALMPLPIAILASTLIVQIPLFFLGGGQRMNSRVLMSLAAIAAAYLAASRTWIRFAAWQFLAIVALNAVAALIMLTLRGAVRRMEARCGL